NGGSAQFPPTRIDRQLGITCQFCGATQLTLKQVSQSTNGGHWFLTGMNTSQNLPGSLIDTSGTLTLGMSSNGEPTGRGRDLQSITRFSFRSMTTIGRSGARFTLDQRPAKSTRLRSERLGTSKLEKPLVECR